jgi:adenine-specific DNA-methyltransferase
MIYIDPPYNTGSKREYKDKFRHDEWLNMMYPRLALAKELLREDGVIFVSINDDEQARLKLMCDEIFDKKNFVSNIIWQKSCAQQNCCKHFSKSHDFILCYAKDKNIWRPNLLPRDAEKDKKTYKLVDSNGAFTKNNMTAIHGRDIKFMATSMTAMHSSDMNFKTGDRTAQHKSKGTYYPITAPNGAVHYPSKGRFWRYTKDNFEKLLAENRIYFGKDGNSRPGVKTYINEVKQGLTPKTIWLHQEVGSTTSAKKEIIRYFKDSDLPYFDTPKPTKLIKHILHIAANKEDIVMDFFAGSGSLADAVMQINAEDGGNRRWVMVEYDRKIAKLCRERVKKAAQKIRDKNPSAVFDIGFDDYTCAATI